MIFIILTHSEKLAKLPEVTQPRSSWDSKPGPNDSGLSIPKDHFWFSWRSLLRGGGVVFFPPIRVSWSEHEGGLDEGPAPGPHLSLGGFSKLLSQVIKRPLPSSPEFTQGFLGLLGNHRHRRRHYIVKPELGALAYSERKEKRKRLWGLLGESETVAKVTRARETGPASGRLCGWAGPCSSQSRFPYL